MPEETVPPPATLALNTRLEDDFIAPLTAVRGALELLRDHPDLTAEDRQRFVESALGACARLETGVMDLARSVYAAAQRAAAPDETSPADLHDISSRIRFDEARGLVEIDLSDFEFASTAAVNAVFDALEARIAETARSWYVVVDQRNCSVWPEAWVAFAWRGKRLDEAGALATVYYAEDGARHADPEILASHEAALARVAELRDGDTEPTARAKG